MFFSLFDILVYVKLELEVLVIIIVIKGFLLMFEYTLSSFITTL